MDTVLVSKRISTIESAAVTDRGQRRELNEDTIFHRSVRLKTGTNLGLYLVCDGLGGHRAGEVASSLAVETVTRELAELFSSDRPAPALRPQIQKAVAKANRNIRAYALTHAEEAANLGTTITLMLIYEDWAYIANVGDSRVYAWRSGQLIQITKDHSLVAEMVKQGLISESEAPGHPQRNLILKALGVSDHVPPDIFEWELQPGDKFLLCSDGLWGAFPDSQDLAKLMARETAPRDLCKLLVDEANRRDGSDNISAVVVKIAQLPFGE